VQWELALEFRGTRHGRIFNSGSTMGLTNSRPRVPASAIGCTIVARRSAVVILPVSLFRRGGPLHLFAFYSLLLALSPLLFDKRSSAFISGFPCALPASPVCWENSNQSLTH